MHVGTETINRNLKLRKRELYTAGYTGKDTQGCVQAYLMVLSFNYCQRMLILQSIILKTQ